MDTTSRSYYDMIYRVLENWYVKFAQFTPKLIVGIVVFSFFVMFSKYLSKTAVNVMHRIFPNSKKEDSVVTIIGIFRFIIMLLGTFIALEIMGFSSLLWKFIGSLGVAGIIAGVALKDLVSSMFSGMLIGIDKAFKTGDYITIGNYSGTVQDIGFLTTKIITDDGKKAYIPNQVIFNAPFYNISASPQRRIILDFEIPADEDIHKAQNSILEVIRNLPYADRPETAEVNFTNYKQGNFTLQVKFWLAIGANMIQVRSNALSQIKTKLDEIKIPLVTPTSINIVGDPLTNDQ
ncbi:mechanosensitive ion channel family protein [Chryseobacterium echinoideorum]|uniref:mechanosensitive ion channel family protein n=1 Tax=Chryseobacterium echinoideorum TaxID=1549648 RepID=UPI0011856443|nr:mechanosensitive ion channel family protein [Chryseobacterium echinoideorum]